MGREGYLPLFETKEAKGRIAFKIYAISVFVGVCMIWVYRATHVPKEGLRWAWFCMFGAEIWFGIYWIFTQSARWRPVYRSTFKERLSHRYEDELPGVDIFVCTADPTMEPPTLVINTVLSVMAYDYPPEKLSIYLSDDGGSDLTFYALLEASHFAKHWIPFCKKFKVDPRSPAVYFGTTSEPHDTEHANQWLSTKNLYEEMANRIDTAVKLGHIPSEIRAEHKGFAEWHSVINSGNHHTILQIIIDGRDPNAVDIEGSALPTLVYMAREKRPQHPHNFKAGALNALMRVSSVISNGPIILTVDCDMYSNNAETVRDVLCLFMDEEKGHEIAFVQFPQNFDNLSKNDIYAHSFKVVLGVELHGMDAFGGPLYIGTGCFFRRESLCGKKYGEDYKEEWKKEMEGRAKGSAMELEDRAKGLASCTCEVNTQWGKEMGLKYGCPVEDVITGLAIQCRGWKSIYLNPTRKAFLGVAPTTLLQTLVQHKRWTEGHLQIFLTKHCSFIQGHGKIKLRLQMGYAIYNAWALNAFPTLCYVAVPSLALLNGISLFPRVSSPWFVPFAYVTISKHGYSLGEGLCLGETIESWWNLQRMWLYKRTASYFFATIDAALQLSGLAKSAFAITAKATDEEVAKRYDQEIMEFGSTSPMFTILATLAMLNFFCLIGAIKRVAMGDEMGDMEALVLQFVLCGVLVIINWPIYQGLFLRKDMGRLPISVAFTSIGLAALACLMPIY
ncbi:cellulose synthase-like protein E6 isoform X1 [Magnolia sinica]|uniref:cellulose synthase-like protein E6 isoform X1 n=1 Tax=Magnolia sinica TaxID=86752 RepID=UPI00265AC4BD|nr:cellulose synthase-like protein E6 isoform X1 [Magnolia sinica]